MIETKKVLATEHKEEKMVGWNDLEVLEDEKWKAKLVAEEKNLKAVD